MNPTSLPFDFHVHDAVRVEYRVSAGAPMAPNCALIERETRSAGGNGVVMALALAKWGAQVLLTSNAIGDDAHGRFLVAELQNVPNLRFEPTMEADSVTPYAILLRTQATIEITTLLSPTASNLRLPGIGEHQARHFIGAGNGSAAVTLDAASQNYAVLAQSLRRAAEIFRGWAGLSADFASVVTRAYQASFEGPSSILSREETEAICRAAR